VGYTRNALKAHKSVHSESKVEIPILVDSARRIQSDSESDSAHVFCVFIWFQTDKVVRLEYPRMGLGIWWDSRILIRWDVCIKNSVQPLEKAGNGVLGMESAGGSACSATHRPVGLYNVGQIYNVLPCRLSSFCPLQYWAYLQCRDLQYRAVYGSLLYWQRFVIYCRGPNDDRQRYIILLVCLIL